MKGGYVYILASKSNTLYIGVTSELLSRVATHKDGTGSAFTGRYRCHRLIYFEEYPSLQEAISREKQLKGWVRRKKEALIAQMNPAWIDLFPGLTGEATNPPDPRHPWTHEHDDPT
jgi:putative endonuclease